MSPGHPSLAIIAAPTCAAYRFSPALVPASLLALAYMIIFSSTCNLFGFLVIDNESALGTAANGTGLPSGSPQPFTPIPQNVAGVS